MFTFRDLDMKQYTHCMAILQIIFIDGAKNQYMIILITLSTLDSQRKIFIFYNLYILYSTATLTFTDKS